MTIAENVVKIRDKIGEAAVRSGRSPRDITFVAATKMNSADRVKEAIKAGVDAVGENRVQELLEKNALGAYAGVPLHFIGHLQRNKVRQIVGLCDLIESADSRALLELIGGRASAMGITQNVLIEVNIGKEPAKSGVMPEELEELLASVGAIGGISVLGLMAIPPASSDPNQNRRYFDAVYKLFVDIKAKKYDNVSMRFLSMGMSDSFVEAILAGANMVRIGSAVFGARNY